MGLCKYSYTIVILGFWGCNKKSFRVLLENTTLLQLSLSIFDPVSLETKPWNTLAVKQCHLMNTYH